MSVLSAIKTYLATYTGLKTGAPLWVDYLGSDPTQYAVVPLAGGKIVEEYIDGGSLREYPFAFQSMESTADELARLENNGFYELLSDWLDAQTAAGTLPVLGTGKTTELIEATTWGYLFEQGVSDTGIYQVNCRLVYHQK
jgi:hypothetical protein